MLLQTLYMGDFLCKWSTLQGGSDCVNSFRFETSLFSSCRNTNVLTREWVQVDHELNSLAGQSLSFGYKCFPHVNYFLHFIPSQLPHIYFWLSVQHFFFSEGKHVAELTLNRAPKHTRKLSHQVGSQLPHDTQLPNVKWTDWVPSLDSPHLLAESNFKIISKKFIYVEVY